MSAATTWKHTFTDYNNLENINASGHQHLEIFQPLSCHRLRLLFNNLYDEIPSADKYVCTFRAEKDKDAQGTLKYREKGYYYFTYEVFYSTGVPYEINSEEKEAQTMRAVPDEIHPEQNTKSVYKEIQIMGSRGALLRKFNLEIEFVW